MDSNTKTILIAVGGALGFIFAVGLLACVVNKIRERRGVSKRSKGKGAVQPPFLTSTAGSTSGSISGASGSGARRAAAGSVSGASGAAAGMERMRQASFAGAPQDAEKGLNVAVAGTGGATMNGGYDLGSGTGYAGMTTQVHGSHGQPQQWYTQQQSYPGYHSQQAYHQPYYHAQPGAYYQHHQYDASAYAAAGYTYGPDGTVVPAQQPFVPATAGSAPAMYASEIIERTPSAQSGTGSSSSGRARQGVQEPADLTMEQVPLVSGGSTAVGGARFDEPSRNY
ncbi:hypothetical protein HK101_003329 [Irineochytrium annulatum]|nr:hypothetical protein HK101_003329 [Irineochytrium annulatum]